jgi:perosamine synthetase
MSTQFEPGVSAEEEVIPLSVPEIRGNEWKYMKECLDTNWVSSVGSFVNRFELAVAEYLGIKHAVATVNGTAALHIALLVAGVEPDDEVLVPALTFIAPVNAVRYVGAWPVFMDAEPEHYQIDPQKLSDFVEEKCRREGGALVNRTSNRRVRAILPVHILGHPCDMDPILEIARKHKLTVIEDATESLGSQYRGRKAGALGDIAALSFNGNKIITTGGGGMLVTSNDAWAQKARYFTTQAKDDPVEYIHNEIGYNYRMTNIQAAMGVAQMEKLDEYVKAKRDHARLYDKLMHGTPGITLPGEASWAHWNYWLYTILVDENNYGMSSRELMRRLEKANVQSRPLWHPVHSLLPSKDCQAFEIETADVLYRTALSIPSFVALTDEQIEVVARRISKALN